MNNEKKTAKDERAEKRLKKRMAKAEKIYKDKDKFDAFMERLEKKLNNIPKIGKKLSSIPVLVEMLKMCAERRYNEVPIGTIITVLAALVYFVSPIDAISDFIPVIGYVDDAAVIVCVNYLAEDDIREFKEWRDRKFASKEQTESLPE